MDYQRIYNQIIERAKTRQLDCYKEKHHIIPKCMGGSNDKTNLVELTAREHFLCHRLLCIMYPEDRKLKYALVLMNIGKQKYKEVDYQISSRVYEGLKIEHSLLMRGNKGLGRPRTEEEKRNIGEKNKHNKPKGFGKKPKDFGKKISESHKTRIYKKGIKHKPHKTGYKHSYTHPTKPKKPIIQYNLNNEVIRIWDSASKAGLFLNKHSAAISECCSGKRKTAYGYKWKFK